MNELDLAMLIIFGSGVIGVMTEPWHQQPYLMVEASIIYLCLRITALIVGTIVVRLRKEVELDDVNCAEDNRRDYRSY